MFNTEDEYERSCGYCVQIVGAGAFCLNKAGTKLVTAGRAAFKIISISVNEATGRYELIDCANLMGRRSNPSGRVVTDVAWSRSDESIVAISFAGPHIFIYDIQVVAIPVAKLRLNVDNIHSRTVNRVHFHPSDGSVLLTGSQDGTCNIMDLREPSVVSTFKAHSESGVRDVEFHPSNSYRFASSADNGSLAIWDMRKNERPEMLISAHTEPILSLDWHLFDHGLIATASRDKQIKVWDVDDISSPCLFTTFTPSSLARVKWRPFSRYQLATCSSYLMDTSVNVWDVRRAYLPKYSFIDHSDLVTELFWCDDRAIVSCAKNGNICVASIDQALRMSKVVSPCCLDIRSDGSVATCLSEWEMGSKDAAEITGHDYKRKQSSSSDKGQHDLMSLPTPSPSSTTGPTLPRIDSGASSVSSISASASSHSFAPMFDEVNLGTWKRSTTTTSLVVEPSWVPRSPPPPVIGIDEEDHTKGVLHTFSIIQCSFSQTNIRNFALEYVLTDQWRDQESDLYDKTLTEEVFKEKRDEESSRAAKKFKRFWETCDRNAKVARKYEAHHADLCWSLLPTLAPTFAESCAQARSSTSPLLSPTWLDASSQKSQQHSVKCISPIPSSIDKVFVSSSLSTSSVGSSVTNDDDDDMETINPISKDRSESDFFYENSNLQIHSEIQGKHHRRSRRRRASTRSRDLSDFQESEEVPLVFFVGSVSSWQVNNPEMRRRFGLEGWDYDSDNGRENEWSWSPSDEESEDDDDLDITNSGFFVEDMTRPVTYRPETETTTHTTDISSSSKTVSRVGSKSSQSKDVYDSEHQRQPRTLSDRSDGSVIRQVGSDGSFPEGPLYSYLASKINFLVEMGEVHNATSILVLIASFYPEVTNMIIKPNLINEWAASYAAILERSGLFNQAREIMNFASLSEDAIFNGCLHLQCSNCLKLLDGSHGAFYCAKCHGIKICAICRTVVKGLYVACPGCSHGGHGQHLISWFKTSTKCPFVGCNHECMS